MKFKNSDHEQRFLQLLSRMRSRDAYHRSAAYLMALADLVPTDVFDFEEDVIKHAGIFAGWQTSSSRRATRLMFNLWNGFAYNEANPEEFIPSMEYAVDNIFCDGEYAPYFYEAIRIRFERV